MVSLPRFKLIAEAARDLRKGERWLQDWLKRHPCDQKGEPFYRLAGRTKLFHGSRHRPYPREPAMPLTLVPPEPGRAQEIAHIRGTYLRVAVNRSAGTPDRRLATKLKRIEQEIESGIRAQSGGLTFLAAAVAYMKAGGDRIFLGPIIEYDGTYAIRDKAVETIVHESTTTSPMRSIATTRRRAKTARLLADHCGAPSRRHRAPLRGTRAGRARNPNRFSNMIRRSTCSTLPTPSTANSGCCAIRCSIPVGGLAICSTRTRKLPQSQFAAWHAIYWQNQKRRSSSGCHCRPAWSRNSRRCRHAVATDQDRRARTAAQRGSRDVTARCRRAIS